MADQETVLLDKSAEQVRQWRFDELRRLGYSQVQQNFLVGLIEQGELSLHTAQRYGDDLHIPPETAWWLVC